MLETLIAFWYLFIGTDAACVSQCQHEGWAFGYVQQPSTCYCLSEEDMEEE
jgi:hypothetical protein